MKVLVTSAFEALGKYKRPIYRKIKLLKFAKRGNPFT